MKTSTLLLRGLIATSVLGLALPGQAQADTCALLRPADVKALLGGVAVAKANAGGCNWTAAGSTRKLIAARMKAAGPAAEMAYAGARKNSSAEGKFKVTDEAGIGDKAFAVQTSFGVALFTLKQGRLLQLQFWTGATGTAKDVEPLRPVARKAAAAF